ncbi:MAG: hypothetical protein QOI10_4493 [Solirubrobacterales bacterium]|nr:hypothetical protein [Solirubrobacterales bacterium]
MPRRFARQALSICHPLRASFCAALASFGLIVSTDSLQTVVANGDTRSINFQHTHRDDAITVTFKRNGRYDEDGLKKLNYFLRDWRNDDQTRMDPQLFDILWEVYREVDAKTPIRIVSSYRSPATNAMLRRRSRGVAQFSQHMLGKAIDFNINGVSVEQLRAVAMRLQRGGVGFYPGSFVHVDVGSVRHWPRMTHDQLARVFPNGRTVHVPSDGNPLPGYELAKADIEKRGNGDDDSYSKSKPSLFASLFRGKSSNDEDDEGAATAASPKPSAVSLMAAAVPAKSADPVPVPRAKPAAAATFQLASADVQTVPLGKPAKPTAAPATARTEAKPETPADIINARGFWGETPAAAKQATPEQIAALRARQAVGGADPQSTASISAAFQALAYAPAAAPPAERPSVVAASAPMPRIVRPASPARNPMALNNITTVVAKGSQGLVATSTRLAAAPKSNDVWMRAMILAPSASTSMSVSAMSDPDLTLMRSYFVKPKIAVAMTFSDDPQLGLVCDQFTGPAIAKLATQSFVMRTASLR